MGLGQGKAEVSGWQEEGVWGADLERKWAMLTLKLEQRDGAFGLWPPLDFLTPSCRERLSTHILQLPHHLHRQVAQQGGRASSSPISFHPRNTV